MNQALRLIAVPTLVLIVAAGCGSDQNVTTSSPGAPVAVAQTKKAAAPTTVVAPAPVAVSLSDLKALGSAVSPVRGTIKINGTVYDNSISTNFGCGTLAAWDYDLSRGYKKLTAVIGVDDGSILDDIVTVKLLADGAPIGQATASLGKPTPIEAGVENVLRLRVELSRSKSECIADTGFSTNIAFADAKLVK